MEKEREGWIPPPSAYAEPDIAVVASGNESTCNPVRSTLTLIPVQILIKCQYNGSAPWLGNPDCPQPTMTTALTSGMLWSQTLAQSSLQGSHGGNPPKRPYDRKPRLVWNRLPFHEYANWRLTAGYIQGTRALIVGEVLLYDARS